MTDHRMLAEKILAGPALRHPEAVDALPELTAANVHATLALLDAVDRLAPSLLDLLTPPVAEEVSELPMDRALRDVHWERQKQISQGWSAEHDLQHGAAHLASLAEDYLTGILTTKKTERERLVITAALCVAAIEVIDRREAGE